MLTTRFSCRQRPANNRVRSRYQACVRAVPRVLTRATEKENDSDFTPDVKKTTQAAEAMDDALNVGNASSGKTASDALDKVVGLFTDDRKAVEDERKETVEIFRDALRRISERERQLFNRCMKKKD